MRAARDLLKKQKPKEEVPETTKEEERALSQDEIKGTRGPGKKGETAEDRTKRVCKRWRNAIWLVRIQVLEEKILKLKDFPLCTGDLPPEEKKKKVFGKRALERMEQIKELQALRQEQLVWQIEENLRLQFRLGLALHHVGKHFDALECLERVCANEELIIETAKEKEKRLKMETEEKKRLLKESLKAESTKQRKKNTLGPAPVLKSPAEIAKEKKQAFDNEKKEALRKLRNRGSGADGNDEDEEGNEDYKVHVWAARCAVALFKQTKTHSYLEKAYGHYHTSIECMTVPIDNYDLSTKLRLPLVYYELGLLFENFGSMQAAMDMYRRAMAEFPQTRFYFDCMYRACLVGKYLFFITSDEKSKRELLNKCLDMLVFLLEALPVQIEESHIILLYARTLEASTDPSIRYRAGAAFESLFAYCHDTKQANAHLCDDFKTWNDGAANWLKFAQEIEECHEPLLVKDAYEIYLGRVNAKRRAGKALDEYVDIPTFLKVAQNYANFQNFKDATKYAELALKKDRLNKEVRSAISKYSKIHKAKLDNEVSSVNTLHQRWKERAWTAKSINRLRFNELERLEKQYKKNRFDKEARKLLAYYDKDKWRAKFLFEVSCAIRVQRFVRNKFVCWKVQEQFRTKYLARASAAYSNFQRHPFSNKVRQEILAVNASRFCPRKHAIRRLAQTVHQQNDAAFVILRMCHSFLTRRRVREGIANTKRKRDERNHHAATIIQCLIRKKLAYLKVIVTIQDWAKKAVAAIVIQKFYRWRNTTFQHSVTRIINKMRASRQHALDSFRIIMAYLVRRKIRKLRNEKAVLTAAQIAREKERKKHARKLRRNEAASKIQLMFRNVRYNLMSRVSSEAILGRASAPFSRVSLKLLQRYTDLPHLDIPQSIDDTSTVISQLRAPYVSPGLRPDTPAFIAACKQTEAFITGSFIEADCMMLSTMLRHNDCQLKHLILYNIEDATHMGFEDALLTGLRVCKSIRRISLLQCTFTPSFYEGLYRIIQVENPRLREVFIEKCNGNGNIAQTSDATHSSSTSMALNTMKLYAPELIALNGRLLKDFLNYNIPGLRRLSLHGLYLRDEDMAPIIEGMHGMKDDSGWKNVYGDVFRAPKNLELFSAMVGTGWQLLLLVLAVILYAMAGPLLHGKFSLLLLRFPFATVLLETSS